jgi:tRNA(Ile)-lysidine synthetase-like protein
MRPAGGSGTRKLQDILVDARIPRGARDRLPLVFDGDRLAWVPGVAAAANLVVPAGEEGLHVTLFEVKTMARNPKNPMVDSTNHRQGVIPL